MEKIYQLCPSIKRLTLLEKADAIVRMCIAYVLNGGEYTDVFDTAERYLETINDAGGRSASFDSHKVN